MRPETIADHEHIDRVYCTVKGCDGEIRQHVARNVVRIGQPVFLKPMATLVSTGGEIGCPVEVDWDPLGPIEIGRLGVWAELVDEWIISGRIMRATVSRKSDYLSGYQGNTHSSPMQIDIKVERK